METPEKPESDQHSGRFAIIPSVALDDPRITPALLRLLCVLGTYGNKHGYCWPSRDTLSKRLGGISKPAVSMAMRKLQDYGYVEVAHRFESGGGQKANLYRLLFDQPDPEVTPESLPEVTGGSAPEVTPLNVPYERPILTNSAAAISIPTREQVDGGTAPDAAAAWPKDLLNQTAEQVRQRLHMPANKLPGLRDVLLQYPPHHAQRLITQAACCEERLKVRPLTFTHYANFLIETDSRAEATRQKEANSNGQSTQQSPTPSDEDRRRTAQHDREERGRRLGAIVEKYFPAAAD